MKLIKYSRRHPALAISDDMNRLFNQLWLRPFDSSSLYDRSWAPAFNIRETGDQYLFEAALPGLSKKEIEVTLQDGVLTVSGERKEHEAADGETLHVAELRTGSFCRAFTLPGEVDEESVEARYKDGILSLAVKKLAPVEPERRKIAIK
ncbi:MAG: Hsp20/alpha crystallin family protein [Candidatus Marinimicrobia bacterium]|nr:Hsp20/alpha crystallin family protein [Candidatus Neomarinimicrobiota bacterium]